MRLFQCSIDSFFPGTLPSSHTSIESQHSREGTSYQQEDEETSQQPGEATNNTGEETGGVGEVICEPETEPDKPPSSKSVCNIGTKVSLKEYAEREWRGNTPRAELMKKVFIR